MKVKAFNKRKCKTSVWLLLVFFLAQNLYSQEKDRGYLTGSLDVNANVFIKDSSINAFGLPQYERQFFGGESWLNLQYNIGTLTAGIRYDMFINSNLRNPNDSYSGQGIYGTTSQK